VVQHWQSTRGGEREREILLFQIRRSLEISNSLEDRFEIVFLAMAPDKKIQTFIALHASLSITQRQEGSENRKTEREPSYLRNIEQGPG
jgi:hypothetical protein